MTKVTLYEGNLPSSGKTILMFAGHKLNYLDKKVDKSALLIHNESKIILQAYPQGTERGKILNHLAKHIDKLDYFLANREEFELVTKVNVPKKKEKTIEKRYEISMTHYSTGEKVEPRRNKIVKKSYDLTKDSEW